MGSGVARTIEGGYYGTGAALEIADDKVGFRPKRVTIYKITTQQDLAEHVLGMDDASFLKTDGPTGVRSLVTTEGITIEHNGFSVGTDGAINNSGDLYRFFCEE
jgi:hypothetical protein